MKKNYCKKSVSMVVAVVLLVAMCMSTSAASLRYEHLEESQTSSVGNTQSAGTVIYQNAGVIDHYYKGGSFTVGLSQAFKVYVAVRGGGESASFILTKNGVTIVSRKIETDGVSVSIPVNAGAGTYEWGITVDNQQRAYSIMAAYA